MKSSIIKALREVNNDQLADIAIQMAEIHPVTFEKMLTKVLNIETNHQFIVPHSGQTVTLTTKQFNDLKATAFAGNKIAGIKLLREACGIGLKEPKDLWEDMAAKGVLDYRPDNYRPSF